MTEIGEKVVALLLKQIEAPTTPPQVVMLEPTLIVRESCRAITE